MLFLSTRQTIQIIIFLGFSSFLFFLFGPNGLEIHLDKIATSYEESFDAPPNPQKTATTTHNCHEINSRAWRNATRITNVHEGITATVEDQLMDPNLLKNIDFLIGQTLSLKDSNFRRQLERGINSALMEAWEYKLTYLAIHSLFHEPAQDEYKARQECAKHGSTASPDFLPYQYECPKAKYLVARFPGLGFGASVRLSVLQVLVTSILTNRIPVFIGTKVHMLNAERQRYVKKIFPTDQFSCVDRKDYQCVFLPLSPCTPTLLEIRNATWLEGVGPKELLSQFSNSTLGSHKVLMTRPQDVPAEYRKHPLLLEKVHDRIFNATRTLIDTWAGSLAGDSDHPEYKTQLGIMNMAARRMKQRRKIRVHQYANRDIKFAQALIIYMMRPNFSARKKIAKTIQNVMPPRQKMDPKRTLGMAIRGSDKCKKESTCLPFSKYMELANETGIEELHLVPSSSTTTTNHHQRGYMILTTEDRNLFDQRYSYMPNTKMNNNGTSANDNISGTFFPFDFVVNENDTFQGTGDNRIFTDIADEVILGSMVTIQMQLHAGYVIGNCCSNFHNLVFDFIDAGCGYTQKTMCMQETTNPKYRICCDGDKTKSCNDIRKKFQAEKANNTLLYNNYREFKHLKGAGGEIVGEIIIDPFSNKTTTTMFGPQTKLRRVKGRITPIQARKVNHSLAGDHNNNNNTTY